MKATSDEIDMISTIKAEDSQKSAVAVTVAVQNEQQMMKSDRGDSCVDMPAQRTGRRRGVNATSQIVHSAARYDSGHHSQAKSSKATLSTASTAQRVGALVSHHPAWMWHHIGGSQQGHPRHTGALTKGSRGWPNPLHHAPQFHKARTCSA